MLVARRTMRITTLLFVLFLARAAQAQSILGGSGTGSGGGLGNGLLDALPGVAGLLNTDPVERPRDIETRVLNAGQRAVPLATPGAQPLVLAEATVERLAEDEHEAWMLHQLLNGYRAGSRRDEHTRIHHLMVPYGELAEAEKDKDRAIVRNTPRLLASIGWGVVSRSKEVAG